MVRIAKFIAAAGICSRRQAEQLVLAGVVQINGQLITTPATNINNNDKVTVRGQHIQHAQKPRLWLYHKPVGLLTTHHDPQGRPTIFASLPKELGRVISVGRLDINSEGLLLLTNNGALARYLEHPANNIRRTYKARVYQANQPILKVDNQQLVVDNITYRPKKIKLLSQQHSNAWYEIELAEGKNREVRKIFAHFGLAVNRLIRTDFGSYSLGKLAPGQVKEVKIDQNYCWQV